MINIKTIGKVSIFFAVVGFLFQSELACVNGGGKNTRIMLHVTDTQGREVTQATVGVPLIVKTIVSGTSDQLPEPLVQGLEDCVQLGSQSGISVNTINGVTTIKKEWNRTIRFDREGDFTLGPAQIQGHGLESGVKTIHVSAKAVVDAQQKREAFITLVASKTTLFYGEPLELIMTFFYADDSVRIEGIEKPTLDNADVHATEGPISGQQEIDGVLYSTVQWKCTMFPRVVGDCVIGAVRGTYTIQRRRQSHNSFFDMFDTIMSGASTKQMYSNALKISVLSLPENEEPVTLVGQFTKAELIVSKSDVKQSEGVSAKLLLTGKGNAPYVNHPLLKLPEQLVMYEGDSRATASGKYEYEYVIQGLKPGTYTVESQRIAYFDPLQKMYKVLQTNPVTITIASGVKEVVDEHKQKEQTQLPLASSLSDDSVNDKKDDTVVNAFFIHAPWQSTMDRPISLTTFLLAILFPFLCAVALFCYRYFIFLQLKNAPERAYKNAFKNARQMFNKARNRYYDGLLYHMFRELFAARKRIPVNQITEEVMEKALYDAGIAEKDITQWRLLFAQLAESAFTAHKQTYNRDAFFNQAWYWLHEWEKIL